MIYKDYEIFKVQSINFVLSLSFAAPKESNPRKGAPKRQPPPFCSPATRAILAQTKTVRFAPFSGFPSRSARQIIMFLINYYCFLSARIEMNFLLFDKVSKLKIQNNRNR
jgi:hypothetical protein